jgi:hypothetical protein
MVVGRRKGCCVVAGGGGRGYCLLCEQRSLIVVLQKPSTCLYGKNKYDISCNS